MIVVCIGAGNIFLYFSDLPAFSYVEGEREGEKERGGGGERPFSFMQLHFLNVILYYMCTYMYIHVHTCVGLAALWRWELSWSGYWCEGKTGERARWIHTHSKPQRQARQRTRGESACELVVKKYCTIDLKIFMLWNYHVTKFLCWKIFVGMLGAHAFS